MLKSYAGSQQVTNRYHRRISDNEWPQELRTLFAGAVTAEYASLTRAGAPVTVPVTPYIGPNRTIDLSTGLAYPAKAERARRNPRVCLLFADPLTAGMEKAPVALVQGHAAVRDADLQANTDRYARESIIKMPDTTKGQPKFVLRRMTFYYRAYGSRSLLFASGGGLTGLWQDRLTSGWLRRVQRSRSRTPLHRGSDPPAWREPPADWRSLTEHALANLPLADLTTVDDEGVPLCVPVEAGGLSDGLSDGVVDLVVGEGAPGLVEGPACLTLHGHPCAIHRSGEPHTDGNVRDPERFAALQGAAGARRLESRWQPGENRHVVPRSSALARSATRHRGGAAWSTGSEGSFRLTTLTSVELGKLGVWWSGSWRSEDGSLDAPAELESLGYGALWSSGRFEPGLSKHFERLLAATTRIVVASGIVTVWHSSPGEVSAAVAGLDDTYPGRFLLGLGASHAPLVENYARPYSQMVRFLDGLDAAPHAVAKDRRVLAALKPRMLELARKRAAGAHPYLVPARHTARARAVLGPGPLLAPEVTVVLERDPVKARDIARNFATGYLGVAELRTQSSYTRLRRRRPEGRGVRPPRGRGRVLGRL